MDDDQTPKDTQTDKHEDKMTTAQPPCPTPDEAQRDFLMRLATRKIPHDAHKGQDEQTTRMAIREGTPSKPLDMQDTPPNVDDDMVLSLWLTVRPGPDQHDEMTYHQGPYDITTPTWELRRLVELSVEHGWRLAHDAMMQARQPEPPETPAPKQATWTETWPTEPGRYWFYGWAFGRKTTLDGKPVHPELDSVKVVHDAMGNPVYIREGHFFYRQEGAIGLFAKADIPADLPTLEGATPSLPTGTKTVTPTVPTTPTH